MKKFTNIDSLELISMTVLDAAIENKADCGPDISYPMPLKVKIAFRKGFNVNEEKAIIKTYIRIDVLNESQSLSIIKANFTIDFLYEVKALSEYLSMEGEDGKVDASLLGTLLSTSYSTARGIVYTRCMGAIPGNIILPIISMQELIDISDQDSTSDKTQTNQ
jgi:hypothetical protein